MDRVEAFQRRYKIKKLCKKDPKQSIRIINGENSIKCPFSKTQMEEYFTQLFQKKEMDETKRPSWWNVEVSFTKISNSSKDALSRPITSEEVENVTKRLPFDSTPGFDGLNYKAWTLLPKYGDILSNILSTWLSYGTIPKDGCVAKQILLYKKGKIKELKNWRPISLQQALTKIFMKVVQNRVIKVLEQDKIMSGMQKGFLRNNDCLERVQSLSMIIGSPRRNKQDIFNIFYDIQNTFGSVPQELIFETLEQHDFPKVFIDVIKSFYQRDATVVVNGKIRKKVLHQEVGVKQGCPLFPPLIYISTGSRVKGIRGKI